MILLQDFKRDSEFYMTEEEESIQGVITLAQGWIIALHWPENPLGLFNTSRYLKGKLIAF